MPQTNRNAVIKELLEKRREEYAKTPEKSSERLTQLGVYDKSGKLTKNYRQPKKKAG